MTSRVPLSECDIGFIPDEIALYKSALKDFRVTLKRIQKKYKIFTQQQVTFVTALERCREAAYQSHARISSNFQVDNYHSHVSENLTDKRILKLFLELVCELTELKQRMIDLTKRRDDQLERIYRAWSKILSPRYNIANLRPKKDNPQLKYLSCDELDNHFGGIISVLATALEFAKSGIARLEESRAYLPEAAKDETERALKKLERVADKMHAFPTQKFKNSIKYC